jgi:hypothetical protein
LLAAAGMSGQVPALLLFVLPLQTPKAPRQELQSGQKRHVTIQSESNQNIRVGAKSQKAL